MSEYHKIETLYERDERTHKLVEPLVLKNRIYGALRSWQWTEKIDGTNIRISWDGSKFTIGGRTDNAQIHADLIKWIYERVSVDALAATFSDSARVVLYGEGYGAGIQKGGGNYSPEKKLILFDVMVIDGDGKGWWLADENVRDIGAKLALDVVPSFGDMSLEDATDYVRRGIVSRAAVVAGTMAEGLIGRPIEALFDKKGHRLIVKLKTKDFAPAQVRATSPTPVAVCSTETRPSRVGFKRVAERVTRRNARDQKRRPCRALVFNALVRTRSNNGGTATVFSGVKWASRSATSFLLSGSGRTAGRTQARTRWKWRQGDSTGRC